MKKILLFLTLFLAFSCVKDDSTMIYPENNPNFSHITITSDISEFSVDYGEILTIEPTVTQTVADKELEYEWIYLYSKEDSVICGRDKILNYKFKEIGTHTLRLEVKNEDYSEFMRWTLDVRANGEGLYVLGVDEGGESNFSFARKLSETDIYEGKELTFKADLLASLNVEADLSNIIEIKKSYSKLSSYGQSQGLYLYIYTDKYVYMANEKTFSIINSIKIDDYFPGRKVVDVSCYGPAIAPVKLFLDNGECIDFYKKEFTLTTNVLNPVKADEMYPNLFCNYGTIPFITPMWVDYSTSTLWGIIRGFWDQGSLYNHVEQSSDGVNIFEDYDIVTLTQMNGNTKGGQGYNTFVLAKEKANPANIRIVEYGTNFMQDAFKLFSCKDYTLSADCPITQGQVLTPNARNRSIYYFNGSDIYCWYVLNTDNNLPTSPIVTLDGEKEITTMTLSYDMKQLYVGFYDPNASGELKGGMYIYETSSIDSGSAEPVEKYEGICCRPQQVGYIASNDGAYTS